MTPDPEARGDDGWRIMYVRGPENWVAVIHGHGFRLVVDGAERYQDVTDVATAITAYLRDRDGDGR